jgi:hypothetical protein
MFTHIRREPMKKSKLANRVLSLALIAAGLASVAAGQGVTVLAEEVNCVQGAWIEPAECTAAHAEPAPNDRVGGTQGGCGFTNGTCQGQGNACDATPKYNNAAKGTCQAYIGGSDIYKCADDYYKTAVTLTKVTGGCDSVNGDCACRYSTAMPEETTTVEVCNCKSEKI